MPPIYLDHNSTTPMLSEVAQAMAPWQADEFGNPASQHLFGRQARQALEEAREGIGRLLGAVCGGRHPDRVIFTSGGTEANNLALLGLAGGLLPTCAGEALVSAIEHPSVEGCADLLERRGWTVHRLRVDRDGIVDLDALDVFLNERTTFVSVMLANNETGVVQPIAEIAERCARLGVPLHTDAVQAVGKRPIDFRALGVSAMSVAAHKFHGPLGIGALVARHDLPLEPLLTGGFQQGGLRPGTENVALAVGMHVALAAARHEEADRIERMRMLRDRLESGLAECCNVRLIVNGGGAERLPHTSNVAFLGLDRQVLLLAMDQAGVLCATGSACASGSSEPSSVLKAMGCDKEVLSSSLRFSLGATTMQAEIDEAIRRVASVVNRLRAAKQANDSKVSNAAF